MTSFLAIALLPLLLPGSKPDWTTKQARDLKTAAEEMHELKVEPMDDSRFKRSCKTALDEALDAVSEASKLFAEESDDVDAILDDALKCYNLVAVALGEKPRKRWSPSPEEIREREAKREARERASEIKKREHEIAKLADDISSYQKLVERARKQVESLEEYVRQKRQERRNQYPSHISETLARIRRQEFVIKKHEAHIGKLRGQIRKLREQVEELKRGC